MFSSQLASVPVGQLLYHAIASNNSSDTIRFVGGVHAIEACVGVDAKLVCTLVS